MKAICLGVLLMSGFATADSLENDIKKLQSMADVGTNGGDASIITYDSAALNYRLIIKDVLNTVRESDCAFTPYIGVHQVVTNAGSFWMFRESSEAEKILKRLNKSGKIKAAVGYSWDGQEGDSEYCSVESLDIYFTNGQALILSHDSTT